MVNEKIVGSVFECLKLIGLLVLGNVMFDGCLNNWCMFVLCWFVKLRLVSVLVLIVCSRCYVSGMC